MCPVTLSRVVGRWARCSSIATPRTAALAAVLNKPGHPRRKPPTSPPGRRFSLAASRMATSGQQKGSGPTRLPLPSKVHVSRGTQHCLAPACLMIAAGLGVAVAWPNAPPYCRPMQPHTACVRGPHLILRRCPACCSACLQPLYALRWYSAWSSMQHLKPCPCRTSSSGKSIMQHLEPCPCRTSSSGKACLPHAGAIFFSSVSSFNFWHVPASLWL